MDTANTISLDEMKSKLASYLAKANPEKIKALYTILEREIEFAATEVSNDDAEDKLEEEFLEWDADSEPPHSFEQVKREGMEILKSIREDDK